jgi:hypothetical protein
MSLTLELITGSELTLGQGSLSIVRKFRVRGTLPYTSGGDAFDYVATNVMSLVQTLYPLYATPQGTLFWNSIQLHESHYAQLYEVSVTYSPFSAQAGGGGQGPTGAYLIRVEHAAGTAKATAGELMNTYPAAEKPGASSSNGTIWNGQEVVGVDVPFNQTRIVISYRHPQAYLDHAYLRAVGQLVGHPNNDTFLGYDPGEIAYAGGNATESQAEASAEYSFEVSQNIDASGNLEIGGIAIAEKKGFDVVSPVYKWDTDDTTGGTTKVTRPVDYVDVIRPAGREWRDYVSVFGWGGP